MFRVELLAGESKARPEVGRALAVDGEVRSGAGYGELLPDRIEEVAAAVVQLMPEMFDRRHARRAREALQDALHAASGEG